MWAMLEDLYRRYREFTRQLWVTVAAFSISGILLAVFANRFSAFVPDNFALAAASESVGSLLNVLTTSMLTVTTFSLTIVRGTISQVASSATPRATQLLAGDPMARETLGTFVGSFLFGIFGIIGLSAGYYNDKGQVILFIATLVVIVAVTIKLVRWITATPDMGRLDDTLQRIEVITKSALAKWRDMPALGCSGPIEAGEDSVAIFAPTSGHVYHISFSVLQTRARELKARIVLTVQPGTFTYKGTVIARVVPDDPETEKTHRRLLRAQKEITEAFEIRTPRNLEIDPYGGLIALSEIASRALSPGINDPGTAISVIGCGLRSFDAFLDTPKLGKHTHDRVHMEDIHFDKMLRVFFDPIARDGAGMVEVQVELQRALAAIAVQCDEERSRKILACADLCLERVNRILEFEPDREFLARAIEAE